MRPTVIIIHFMCNGFCRRGLENIGSGFPLSCSLHNRSEFLCQAQTEDLELFGQRLREVSKTFVSEAGQGIILLFPFKFQSGHKS